MTAPEHAEAHTYINSLNKNVAKVASALHKTLIEEGCSSYVKTIYIGYDFNGAMIAALYGHPEYVEIALALPESFESPILIDGTHLTWRTLPVAAIVSDKEDVLLFQNLAKSACHRVRNGQHTVERDNEFFKNAKMDRHEKGIKPRKI